MTEPLPQGGPHRTQQRQVRRVGAGWQVAPTEPGPQRPDIAAYFVENYPLLVAAAWRLTGDKNAAQQIVSTVFVNCVNTWSTIEDPKSYVARALVNAAGAESGWYARHWRLAMRTLADSLRRVEGPDAEEAERSRKVNAAVRRLSLRERQVVVLHHYFQISQAEIAGILGGLHPGTVQTYLGRAEQKLKTALIEYEPARRQADREITATQGDLT